MPGGFAETPDLQDFDVVKQASQHTAMTHLRTPCACEALATSWRHVKITVAIERRGPPLALTGEPGLFPLIALAAEEDPTVDVEGGWLEAVWSLRGLGLASREPNT